MIRSAVNCYFPLSSSSDFSYVRQLSSSLLQQIVISWGVSPLLTCVHHRNSVNKSKTSLKWSEDSDVRSTVYIDQDRSTNGGYLRFASHHGKYLTSQLDIRDILIADVVMQKILHAVWSGQIIIFYNIWCWC